MYKIIKEHSINGLAATCLLFGFVTPLPSLAAVVTKPVSTLDLPTRLALAHPLKHLDEGLGESLDVGATIHRNFPQIIEQNIARLDSSGAAKLLNSLSDLEMSDLAALYTRAINDTGHHAQLLNLWAIRLNEDQLVRVSNHFGFAVTFEAINNYAPSKIDGFLRYANPSSMAPVNIPVFATPAVSGFVKYYNWTPQDIYLDLRTAQIGSLGVRAALLETSFVVAGPTMVAWNLGTAAGAVIADLMARYAPDLYNLIGKSIATAVNSIESATTLSNRGKYEMLEDQNLINSGLNVEYGEYTYGGDYDVGDAWEVFYQDNVGCNMVGVPSGIGDLKRNCTP